MSHRLDVTIVGGGLAGCEAAWQLAAAGLRVRLYEMKPVRRSPAHRSDRLAELVCSNSFRSNNPDNAVGLLKQEMRALGSLILQAAEQCAVPAGDALAMDREAFSATVTRAIEENPLIEVVREEVTELPDEGPVIVATGPLTSDALAAAIAEVTGAERLYFYDAIAPIVDAESIDWTKVFRASRWGKGSGADYVNCPLDEDAYFRFYEELRKAARVEPAPFERAHYFPGCLPIEVIADSGPLSLAHGPMKPVGLVDPRTGRRPFAAVQLRAENEAGTAWNMVGFQTKLRYGEQKRVFRLIPGLEHAEFLRLGSVHRNTYLDAPRLLDAELRLRTRPHIVFAGQITGVEGYVESTACGLLAARFLAARLRGRPLPPPPPDTALGALLRHVTVQHPGSYQPSNVHYGLFPALPRRVPRKLRKRAYRERAEASFAAWLQRLGAPPGVAERSRPAIQGHS